MIQIGQKCPDFKLLALAGTDINAEVSLAGFSGRWVCVPAMAAPGCWK